MLKSFPDSTKTALIILLALLLAPFIVNCFFAYPQTDDFMYSAISRHAGMLPAQHDWYLHWSGRFTSSALLSMNPLVFGSLAGYRMVFAIVVVAQLAALYLLIDVLTKKLLPWRDILICALTLLFAFLDQMDDVRSGLYWMAGVVTYRVAETLLILYLALVLLLNRDEKYRTWPLKCAVLLLGFLLGGTNEVVLVLTLLFTLLVTCYQLARKRALSSFQVATLVAVAAGSGLGLFAPGNFARMQTYDKHKDLLLIARNSLIGSVSVMEVWITAPLTLILIGMVLTALLRRPQLRALFAGFRILTSLGLLLLVIFTAFFIPYWSTGAYPQNRVVNMIYLFFLLGALVNVAVALSHGGELLLKVREKLSGRLWGSVAAIYLVFLFSLGSSNLMLVTRDLISGDSLRYSVEMQEKQARLIGSAKEVCTLDQVRTMPSSLYFCFITANPQHWVNQGYASYFGKKSVALAR